MEKVFEYLKRSITIAWKTVFFNFRQYLPFFIAIIIVQILYGMMTVSNDNNNHVEYQHVMDQYDYSRWYVGGHSLGGAMAAGFAAEHGEASEDVLREEAPEGVLHGGTLEGVILLAAYPTDPLDPDMSEILIYGSEDEVLNMQSLEESRQYAPEHLTEHIIKGGNHAQFGSYGEQKGDGKASLCMEEQIEETVQVIAGAVR